MGELFIESFLTFLLFYIGILYGDYKYLRGRIDLLNQITKIEKESERLK